MTAVWRLWTWIHRRLQSRYEDPQPGWTVEAIKADIDRAAQQNENPQTGRHIKRRSP